MKVEIKPSGALVIKAETGTEAYALRKWVEENKDLIKMAKKGNGTVLFIINTSLSEIN